MEQDYFLGLDLGTGSLGWAVTNEQYEIQRAHGKALWGVRLFESANTAEERRLFRTNRRRLARRNWRLDLLQDIFAEEINKIDDGFFLRMKESRYVPADKRDKNGNCPELPYALFVDDNYTDKQYHQQFPTIYHLRKCLMDTDTTPDIRLVYLALHHILKHRGHFLFSGEMETIREFQNMFQQFIQTIQNEELEFHLTFTAENIQAVETILKNQDYGVAEKKKQLIKQLGAKTSCEKAILQLIAGGTVKLSDIFDNDELDNTEQPKICFADSGYEDNAGLVEAALGEQFIIIAQAKAVYDWAVLSDILGESTTLSEAKVAVYEKHKKDLAYLKQLVKENLDKAAYQEIFVTTNDKAANYSAYIGMTKQSGKKVALQGKQCSREDFYAFLRKNVLNSIKDEIKTAYLQQEMEKGTFLPKQVVKDNGVIPHQLHLEELKRIIANLKEQIPLLAEQEEKLIQLFTFRIPYYVGPLNGIGEGEAATNWAVKKSKDKIYPWNFDKVIDLEASAERFIRRMTNKCTYLPQEDVLPKNSLLYSKFEVLNELNNLRLNGKLISVELKQRLYTNLFQHYRKVTVKKLKAYLVREGIVGKADAIDIAGIDGEFKSSLTAYHDFKNILTGCSLTQDDKEDIILNITLFGDDKKLLDKRLKAQYPQLTEGQRKGLRALSYKGWGRLSKAFLDELTAPAPETGEVWTIIRAMWETNDNLMQVLSDRYYFTEAIEKRNGKTEQKAISYQMVEELYVSPAVKRQIWQTLQIVKEICEVQGKAPKRVFIEMAREKQESKRTVSRRGQLMDLYKKCKDETRDWLNELGAKDDAALRSDKLYLYYTQKGRCMYTGEVIPLEDLWDNNKYDIDHIYPQSKTMDDSLNNRVLVKKEANANKSDNYPLHVDIRQKMKSFWNMLLRDGFIEKEKYNRLIRADEFTDDELSGFIARQLVETRQSTKAVASLLKQVLPAETEVVYVKAKIASQFRQDFNLIKVREMNDLHHAKDAYLNIVVGNAYHTKFTANAGWFIKQNPGRSYNLKKMFTSDKDIIRNGQTAWKAGGDGTIVTVRRMMQKNNILVTRRSYEVTGGLFDQQLMKKGKGQVPIKGSDSRLSDIQKYGGYNKAAGTYFMLIESEDKKGQPMRTIEYVPLYLSKQIEASPEAAIAYFSSEERGLTNPRILLPKIKIDTLFKVDGFYMHLSGRTGNQLVFKGANQLLLNSNEEAILKKVLKFVARRKENKNLTIVPQDGITSADLLQLYDTFVDKLEYAIYKVRLSAQGDTLREKREKFASLTPEEQCIILFEILHFFQCKSGSTDLRLIGGKGQVGVLYLNIKISNYKQISIIHQSPAGIYEQEIDLNRL